jgi:hypothetical protein
MLMHEYSWDTVHCLWCISYKDVAGTASVSFMMCRVRKLITSAGLLWCDTCWEYEACWGVLHIYIYIYIYILWHANPLLGSAIGVAQQSVARQPTGKQDSAQARWRHTSGVREYHVCVRGCQETSRHPVRLQREWGTWRNNTVERPVRPLLGYRKHSSAI